ncbi:MAG: class I SAM-dependent methyltransferase [Burkholderiales bacterium]
MTITLARQLVLEAARPYRRDGFGYGARHYYYFARGKLGLDPIYLAILERGFIVDSNRLLDLGCGQLLIAPLLAAARAKYEAGQWFAGWPAPPRDVQCHGIELRPDVVRVAQQALGNLATVEIGDLTDASLPANDVTIMLDVMHYLSAAEQVRLLERICDALAPGGLFITRVADNRAGLSYWATHLGDQCVTFIRSLALGRPSWPRFHVRPLAEWCALLEHAGFNVETQSMSDGTPFANVMLIARRRGTVLRGHR